MAKKAKVKVKSKGKPKTKGRPLATTKARMNTHIQFNAKGENERRDFDMGIVTILRKVTVTVKVFPFLYALIYIPAMFAYMVLSEDACIMLDTLFYMSVLMVVFLVRLSYCVKLCIWHRIQCCLPLLPQPIIFIDNYVYCFGETAIVINVWLAIIIFDLSLINAYKVFIKPTVRR